MELDVKERLINLVRDNECIYDQTHKDYKNNNYKIQLWDNIGAELNLDGNEAKQMWRTLRDGYTRHRKHVKCQKGTSKKYAHYMWSAQMTFLDPTLDARSSDPSSPVTQSPANQAGQSQPRSTKLPKAQEIFNSKSLLKRKETVDNKECVSKKKREDDGVDHLFMSYAQTFKTLSLRKQAELKVVLAKIFAEAELSELHNTSVEQDNNTVPVFFFSNDEFSGDGIKKEDV